jgi:hypothetical protein
LECGKYGPGEDCQADLTGVSCPTVSLCVAVDNGENYVNDVITSTDPARSSSAWTATKVAATDQSGLTGVSCPTASLCVAIDFQGDILTSRDPTGGASTWTITEIDYHEPTRGGVVDFGSPISCGAPTLYVAAVGDAVATSTDPSGGSSAWTVTQVEPHIYPGLQAVSCASASLCVAVDGNGHAILGTSAAPIIALLRRELIPSRIPRIKSMLAQNGHTFSIRVPSSGHLAISWYQVPKGAQVDSQKPASTLIATGKATLRKAGTAKITLTLTVRGRRILSGAHRVTIRASCTFTPTGATSVAANSTFTLTR